MIDPTGHEVQWNPHPLEEDLEQENLEDDSDLESEFSDPEDPEDNIEGYIHEPDDDPYCDECFELRRHCKCRYASTEDEDRADRAEALFVAQGYPELPFPEDEDKDDEEPF